MTNVLLVVLDSARASNTSIHGHHSDTTPFLSSLVADGATHYRQARAPGARSLTSHTSIFSGYHVDEHGVTSAAHKLDPAESIFFQLSRDGYDTAVFTENNWITAVDVGLKDGFDDVFGHENALFREGMTPTEFVAREGRGQYGEYVREALTHAHPVKSLANGVANKLANDYPSVASGFLRASTPADVYADRFTDWVDRRDGPWAACINLMDPHIPYDPSEEYDEWGGSKARSLQNEFGDHKWEFNAGRRPWWQRKAVESLYDGGIRQADAAVERIVSHLDARGELDDTLVVVTSDHGEGFGEPSRIRPGVRVAEHGVAIHEALLHVPLVVRYPGQTATEVVDAPASLTCFPDAVARVRDGEREPTDAFTPDGPVVATAEGLDEPLQERASEYLDDLSAYTATARAVFDATDDGGVEKSITWRERAATVRVPNHEVSYKQSETDDGRVAEVFDTFENAGVRVDGAGVEGMDDSTYQRLEDLGYV